MPNPQSLVLRRSARHDVALRAKVTIAADHAAQVRFSAGTAGRQGCLETDVVDLGAGGVGFLSPVYIPQRCLLDVRVYGLGGDQAQELIVVRARVQRVIMTDRRPAYLIGTAFENPNEETSARIDWLIRQFGDDPNSDFKGA